MYNERIHMTSLLAKAGNAIAALLRCAEFELEERLISCANYTEVVRHCGRLFPSIHRSGLAQRLASFQSWQKVY